ncbi:DUF1131 family protein [Tenacibaculum sp. S7007]|uniref:DUF1131 family protein n=1 Tax=Tenacibaculum pelagium TaxID=2759527 RepID=A0A839ALK8_9FLAO|nr:DUF1131 family protein [Tenacibaculum pelagium]MBA6155975.1 DUF1131 family protein [Tenacibaculum pelagium]
MRKLILFGIIISGILIGCKEKKTTKKLSEITISNNGINKIDLGKCINIDSLKIAFPDYKISSKIGQQDGPDYQYFEVKKDSTTINFIMSEQEGCLVDEINATTNLPDIYGVKIGMTYEEVKKLRPEITHKTNYHFHTILSTPNSNLKYEISGTFDGPDKQDFIYDEVKKWKVTQFLIRGY